MPGSFADAYVDSGGGGGGGGTVPSTLNGLVLDLNADLGITKDGSNKVSVWADQSGAGNNFTQPTGANQPTWTTLGPNGHATLLFTPVATSYLKNTTLNYGAGATYPFTAFFVVKRNAAFSAFGLWYLADNSFNNTASLGFQSAAFEVGYGFHVGLADPVDSRVRYTDTDTTAYHIIAVQTTSDGGIVSVWQDGVRWADRAVLSLNGNSVPLPQATLGAWAENNWSFVAGFLNGNVSRVLYYKRGLADTDLLNVTTYLQSIYGVLGTTASRPDFSGHQYGTLTAITADRTLSTSDYFVTVNCTSGNVTIKLPNAQYRGSHSQYVIERIDNSANTLTIKDEITGYTIEGAATLSVVGEKTYTLQSDGSQWRIITTPVPLTTLGDTLYEDATPTPVRLAGNTTTTLKFLSQVGNGTISAAPSWEVAPINGLLTYMFIDAASVGTGVGYKQAVDLGHFTPAAGASVTAAGATTGTIIASFATNAGFPNLTLMPDGLFHIHIHAKRSVVGAGSIYAQIYQRTSGGVETLLVITENTEPLTSNEVEYDIHAVTGSAFPLSTTDRIVVKFIADVTSGTPDITIYYDGVGVNQTSSRVELPGPAIDSANFVPSTRAVNVTAPITGGGALSADITVGFDSTVIRTKLTANKTYYVRTDGSDSNDGSANDAAHAWLTPQHAIDYLKSSVDCAGFDVTVNVADGTYSSADSIVAIQGEIPDIGQLKFTGNTTTPGNVVWSSTIDTIRLFGTYTSQRTLGINGFPHFEGMKLSSATRPAIYLEQAWMSYGHIEFSTVGASEAHIRVVRGSLAIPLADYTISAGAVAHLEADSYGYINYSSVALTVTLTGTPAFSVGFAYAHNDGQIFGANITFSGSATGPRYVAGTYGTITSTITFPGSLAGTTSIGGLYNNTPLTLSIPKADGSNDGYLSSGDWTTFNGKLDPATVSSQAYNGGDFTASGSMTWTVDAGDLTNFKYYINGKVMTIWFSITASTVGGTASNTLLIKIPASKTANDLFTGIGKAFNGGAGFFVDMFTLASGTVINLRKVDGSNWTLETNATQVRGQITIEIQ